ncbi:MAG TPA: preprotein translocase subunit YajC [Stellaceae bacterium]|nr:preprotein translocase subunit YajC [Stellaceae bacterium]
MFISPAYAQGLGGLGGSGDALVQMLPIVLIIVVMYFLLMRPQQQKAKQLREMLAALRRGDRVVTGGGIIGTIAKVVNDDEVLVEIADGVRVRVARSTISSILAKTEPVQGKPDKKDDKAEKKEEGDEDEADKSKGGSGRRATGGG